MSLTEVAQLGSKEARVGTKASLTPKPELSGRLPLWPLPGGCDRGQ